MNMSRIAAAAALVTAAATGSALAQSAPPPSAPQTSSWTTNWYGTLGYSGHTVDNQDLGTITGRLGTRIGPWFGVEGEFTGGTNHQPIGGHETLGVNDQQAIYGVAYLPVTPNIDLFGRIGVGRTDWNYKGPMTDDHASDRSWNFGGGGQWFFTQKDGLRADYTKENFAHAADADTWTVSYVRKF
jgi:hypothetical protein